MNTMDDIQLLETIERYLLGELSPTEAAQFESMRKTNPVIDQMVLEHSMFLHEMDKYASRKRFSELSEIKSNTDMLINNLQQINTELSTLLNS